MRTLGIDLASQDANTASCRIDWQDGIATVFEPRLGRSNDDLLEEIATAEVVAIDAPFGWPDPFIAAITEYARQGTWPHVWPDRDAVRRLRFRVTDEVVAAQTRLPLSVSSERIAVCAFRCAALLYQATDTTIERTGSSLTFEVYPAGALKVWGLDPRGYKKAQATARRRALVHGLETAAGGGLSFRGFAHELCVRADHALDALVCALVGRAAACGLTTPPPTGSSRKRVAREGWIHQPLPQSLEKLRWASPLQDTN